MRKNHVREKLRAGDAVIGAFLGLGSPNVAELMACAGYDWLVVETEHNGLDSAQIEHVLMALNGNDCIPIVRVPSADPIFIQTALAVGGLGRAAPALAWLHVPTGFLPPDSREAVRARWRGKLSGIAPAQAAASQWTFGLARNLNLVLKF